MINKHILTLVLGTIMSSFGFGQTEFQNVVSNFENVKTVKQATWSLCIKNATSGELLYGNNENKLLTPASGQKVLISSIALDVFGPDFKYNTQIGYSGSIIDGNLEGDLIIYSSADPTFGSPYFESTKGNKVAQHISSTLKNIGIKSINGQIIIDTENTYQPLITGKWLYEDLGNYYGSGAKDFSFRENEYWLYLNTKSEGNLVEINKMVPDYEEFDWNIQCKSYGKGDNSFIYGTPNNYYRELTGTLPPNRTDFKIKGAFANTKMVFSAWLKDELKKKGIEIKGQKLNAKNEGKILTTIQSPSMKDIIHRLNMKSVNLYAESMVQLLYLFAGEKSKDKTPMEYFKQLLAERKINKSSVKLYDASGLAPMNLITTNSLCDFLISTKQSCYFDEFYNTLPIAGISGSMRSLGKSSPAANNLRAKSGYMQGVRSYSGYYKNKEGKERVFSIIINNYNTSASSIKQEINKIIKVLPYL